MTVKTSISLTDEQERYARQLVESGQFSSLSAVLQRGLDMVRRETELHAAERDGLRALIEQRRNGAFIDLSDADVEIRTQLTRKRAERGAL